MQGSCITVGKYWDVEMLIYKILSYIPCSMECKHCASDMSGAIAIYFILACTYPAL